MIEGDLRAVRAAPPAAVPAPAAYEAREETPRAAMPPSSFAPPAYIPQALRPASGLCAAAETGIAESRRRAGTFCRSTARIPCRRAGSAAGRPADAAARHQRNPRAARSRAAHRDRAGIAAGSSAGAGHTARGTGVVAIRADRRVRKRDQRNLRGRQGAGEFVELHRRRAPRRAGRRRSPRQREGGEGGCEGELEGRQGYRHRQGQDGDGKEPSNITSKIRSLLVGASVVVIVLGTFKMAMTLLDTGSAPSCRRWNPPIRRRRHWRRWRTAPSPRCRHRLRPR